MATRSSPEVYLISAILRTGDITTALQAGIAVEVLRRSGLALDVDEPQDLAQLLAAFAAGAGRRTRELLVDTAVGRRLDLALATLASASGEELAGAQG